MVLGLSLVVLAWGMSFVSPQECMEWNDAGQCVTCNLYGYLVIDANSQCRATKAVDCAQADASGNCLYCVNGLAPGKYSCGFRYAPSCAIVNGFSQSGTCMPKFYLDTTKSCLRVRSDSLVDNCAVYSPAQVCLNCFRGFYLSSEGKCLPSPPNCAIPALPFKCLECPDQSFIVPRPISSNFWIRMFNFLNYGVFDTARQPLCVQNPDPNCEKSSSPAECSLCKRGYYVNDQKTCALANTIDFCAYHATRTACATCDAGRWWTGTVCALPVDPNCAAFDSPSTCSRCAQKFYLDSASGKCLAVSEPSDSNCDVFGSATACQFCKKDFTLFNTQCKPGMDMCAVLETDTTCRFCVAGHKLVDGSCVPTAAVSNCLYYDSNGNCARCNRYNALQADKTCAVVRFTQCGMINTDGTCKTCTTGTLANGECTPVFNVTIQFNLPSNTNFTLVDGKYYSYQLDNLVAEANGKGYYRRIENCGSQYKNECIMCHNGYKFASADSSICEINTSASSECLFFTTDCIICKYFDPTGVSFDCTPIPSTVTPIPNCLFQSHDMCVFCNTGYNLNVDQKACSLQPDFPDSCYATFNTTNSCYICKDGYSKTACSSILSTTDCNDNKTNPMPKCTPTANLAYCTRNTWYECLKCDVGYELNPSGFNCTKTTAKLPPNCQAQRGGVCVHCADNFVRDATGACVAATLLWTGNDCEVFESDSGLRCTHCRAGYALSSGACSTIDSLVRQYPALSATAGCKFHVFSVDANGIPALDCQECSTGYYLSGKSCVAKQDFLIPAPSAIADCLHSLTGASCDEYSASHSASAPLAYVWLADSFNLTAMPQTFDGCAVMSKDFRCIFCGTQFYLSKGKCVRRLIDNCELSSSTGSCVKCGPGFYLQDNACLAANPIGNCLYYDSQTSCSACSAGFALAGSKALCLANCEQADQASCVLCSPLFYPTSPTSCASVGANPLPNCKYFSALSQCLKCERNFALMTDGSCQPVAGFDYCAAVVQSSQKCDSCAPGFTSNPQGDCVAVANPIDGCWLYDQADATRCVTCKPTHYKTSANSPCLVVGGDLGKYIFYYKPAWVYL